MGTSQTGASRQGSQWGGREAGASPGTVAPGLVASSENQSPPSCPQPPTPSPTPKVSAELPFWTAATRKRVPIAEDHPKSRDQGRKGLQGSSCSAPQIPPTEDCRLPRNVNKCRFPASVAVLSCHLPERAGQSTLANHSPVIDTPSSAPVHGPRVGSPDPALVPQKRGERAETPPRPRLTVPSPVFLLPCGLRQCCAIGPTTDRPPRGVLVPLMLPRLHEPAGRSSCRAAFARVL